MKNISAKRESYRNFFLLLIANAILGSAMPMLIVLGGLAGLQLAPHQSFVTLPPSIQMLAGLIIAAPMSMFMGRYGRKTGFLLGVSMAGSGGILGTIALFQSNFLLLCLAHVALGAALICFGYFRFAAGETVPAKWQPVAISLTLGSGLIAALIGPEVFIQTKDYFQPVLFAGAYAAIVIISVIGAIPILLLKLPGAISERNESAVKSTTPIGEILKRPSIITAMLAAAISQGTMVLMMTPTPFAMVCSGYGDETAGDVIRWHVIAMFAPSFVTGIIIKRYKAMPIIIIGMVFLSLAALLAMTGTSLYQFYGALILLGIGWNFGFVGSTSLLVSALKPNERAKIQGANDTLIALSSTITSFTSGALIGGYGWNAISVAILILVTITLFLFILLRMRSSRIPA